MNTPLDYTRMLDKNHCPSEQEIQFSLGSDAYLAWIDLKNYLDTY